jgi:hypothetical protein
MNIDEITGHATQENLRSVTLYQGLKISSSRTVNKDGNEIRITKFENVHPITIQISNETYLGALKVEKRVKLLIKTIKIAIAISIFGGIGLFISMISDSDKLSLWTFPFALGPYAYILIVRIVSVFLPDDYWESSIARKYQRVIRRKSGNNKITIFTPKDAFRLR